MNGVDRDALIDVRLRWNSMMLELKVESRETMMMMSDGHNVLSDEETINAPFSVTYSTNKDSNSYL